MTQYNSLNVKLSNSQLNKLKSAIKNGADVILRLSSNMVGNSNNETNFPHNLLLTNRQILSLRKAFNNHTSADIKFSKAQLTKMQSTDAVINKKILGSGNHITLVISNDDMQDLLKIVKLLEDRCILLDGINETVENEVKEQKGGFLSMLLGTLGASLLGNTLAGRGVIRGGEGTIEAGYGSKIF